jgi:hypothetical protein
MSLTSNFFQRYSRPLSPIPTNSSIMAPKETKRDRERRLLKAQEQEATDAATDGPTDDDVASPEVPIEYNAIGVVRPGTSSAAAAPSTASGACTAAAVAKVGSLSMSSDSESDGIAREKERSASAIPAKRTSSRSSRSKVPKKKAKKSKKAHRRRKESSSSSSSSDRDGRRRGGRGRSPSTTASLSSSGSADSDCKAFYANNTVVKVRNMLKTAPPRAPRDVAKGRFSFDAMGEVQYVKKAEKKGRKEKWMRESRGGRSNRYAEYKGPISHLGHSGNDRVLRRNFTACVQPLMAVEKVLTTVPMGSGIRRELHQAMRILADRLYLLEVERETNPTVAAFVEAKRSKGDERDLAAAVDKYAKLKKSEKQQGASGGRDSARGAGNRNGYNAKPAPAPSSFPVYLPTPTDPAGGYQRAAPRPGVCFDCLEPGHRRGDASCKKKI